MSAFGGADWTCWDDIITGVWRATDQFLCDTECIANVVYLGANEYRRARLHAPSSISPAGGGNEYQRLCGLRIVRVNEPRYFAVGL